MRTTLTLLLLTTGLTPASTLAQTKTPTKSAAKFPTPPKASKAKPAPTRPTAKPTARPAATAAPSTTPPAKNPIVVTIPGVAAQQAPSFVKGNVAVNVGLGLGIGYGYGFEYEGKSSSSPAISLSAEKGIVEGIGPGVISVGGLLGYKSYSYTYAVSGNSHKATWRNMYVAARGAYHYNFTANPKVDTYAGVSLAARIEQYANDYNDSSLDKSYGGTTLDVGVFLGGRYLITDKIGAFAELGYDMSYLKFGLTTKF